MIELISQDGTDGLTRMKAKVLKRYLAKSDHKHRFQDFTDASRDKNGKSYMRKKSAKFFLHDIWRKIFPYLGKTSQNFPQ
jgi:hypothetical protein